MYHPLKIADFYTLAHFAKTFGKLLNELHFYIEVYGKVGVLVSGVHGSAHKEVDVRCLLEKQTADKGSTVTLVAPLLVVLVFFKVILSVLHNLVNGDNTLGNKVNTVDFRRGRYFGVKKLNVGLNLFA